MRTRAREERFTLEITAAWLGDEFLHGDSRMGVVRGCRWEAFSPSYKTGVADSPEAARRAVQRACKAVRVRTAGEIGRLSRNKGKAFERDTANMLTAHTGRKFARSFGQSRMGNEVPDVVCKEGDWPYWIECACGARPDPWEKIEQAAKASDQPALVFARRDRRATLVCMDISTFLSLIPGVRYAPKEGA